MEGKSTHLNWGGLTFVARQEGMRLHRFAENGSTIIPGAARIGTTIYEQIPKAPDMAPDFVLFDGGTNDAEYLAENGIADPAEIRQIFGAAFEETIRRFRQKWPDAALLYVAAHRLCRPAGIQQTLHEVQLRLCEKWNVTVADVYGEADLDTGKNPEQRKRYSFDSVDPGTGLPGTDGSGTHPNFACIEEFYVPVVRNALRNT